MTVLQTTHRSCSRQIQRFNDGFVPRFGHVVCVLSVESSIYVRLPNRRCRKWWVKKIDIVNTEHEDLKVRKQSAHLQRRRPDLFRSQSLDGSR